MLGADTPVGLFISSHRLGLSRHSVGFVSPFASHLLSSAGDEDAF